MKIYLLLSLIILPNLLLGYSPENMLSVNNASPTPTPYKKPVNVERVELDKTEIRLPCPSRFRPESGSRICEDDNKLISIRTIISKPEATTFKYKYTVTGGYIRGKGANVRWDLWEAPPGTYELTAAVDDGCGFCGDSKKVTVTIADCPECERGDCECPTITVTGPSGDTKPGGELTFTAKVRGGSQKSVAYNWTLSAGEISAGQGTPSIRVRVPTDMNGDSITATVEIGGLDPSCNCLQTASETAPVRSPDK